MRQSAMDRGIQGRVAVVTGGARGIGRACATVLAQAGAMVAVFDLDAESEAAPMEVQQQVRALGASFFYRQVDVTDARAVGAGMAAVREALGEIAILVNNAGKGRAPVQLESMDEPEWDAAIALNLKAAMLCSRAVIAGMKQARWGRIVNMSSIAGRGRGEQASLAYAAAKAGVLGFTRQLASEVGPFEVTVNAVAPGAIMSGRVIPRWEARSADERERMTAPIPLRRIGRPEEVARAVLFLASKDASYITGTTLDVNGGRYV